MMRNNGCTRHERKCGCFTPMAILKFGKKSGIKSSKINLDLIGRSLKNQQLPVGASTTAAKSYYLFLLSLLMVINYFKMFKNQYLMVLVQLR
jgi:hypothetical protein